MGTRVRSRATRPAEASWRTDPIVEVRVDVGNLVAILMGVLSLAAIFAAGRIAGRPPAERRAAPGYLVLALGAALQGAALLRAGYSTGMAVLATLLMVVGVGMIARARAARPMTS
jgi:hypothetical protein